MQVAAAGIGADEVAAAAADFGNHKMAEESVAFAAEVAGIHHHTSSVVAAQVVGVVRMVRNQLAAEAVDTVTVVDTAGRRVAADHIHLAVADRIHLHPDLHLGLLQKDDCYP